MCAHPNTSAISDQLTQARSSDAPSSSHRPSLGLSALGLVLALGSFTAIATEPVNKGASKTNDSCECTYPWREYSRLATPDVKALFEAAQNGDEATFNRLIPTIPEVNEYTVDGLPLLTTLLLPARNLPIDRSKRKVWWDIPADQAQAIRAAHAATLPAKERMLATALQQGAKPSEFSQAGRRPALHLATVYGSPEMVRLLLKHGADVNQIDSDKSQTAVEFALDNEFFIRMSYLPVLLDPAQRTDILLAIQAAGAGRPYRRVDEFAEREAGKPSERPSADYLLWPALASLTQGSEIMEAFARTGTAPVFDAEDIQLSPLAYAARSGNLGGVRWLKKVAPRSIKAEKTHGKDEVKYDTWLMAAAWALYPTGSRLNTPIRVNDILTELIQPGMPWAQNNDLQDDAQNPLIAQRDITRPTADNTLLNYLVTTGNLDWVSRIVKMGATVDTPGRDSPLLDAIRQENLPMVHLLLSLGADPLAGKEAEKAALYELISPDYMHVDDDARRKSAAPGAVRHEMLEAMLASLTSRQKAELGKRKKSLVMEALTANNVVDHRMVRALLASGIPWSGLDASAIVAAIASKDAELVGILLDYGVKIDERTAPGTKRTTTPILIHAISQGRMDLLPRLLQAGANPNLAASNGWSAVDWAIARGDVAALDLLLAQGGLIAGEKRPLSPVELAVASGNEAMLQRVSPPTGADLTQVCLKHGPKLIGVIRDSSDAYWQHLLAQGLGRPSTDGKACSGLAPMPYRLLDALLADRENRIVGWQVTRIEKRLRDLKAQGQPLTDEEGDSLLRKAKAAGRQDLISVLVNLGLTSAAEPASKAVPERMPSAADKALEKKLIGHYYLENQREVGSEIVLRANGHFDYMLAYGANDEQASGQWMVRDELLVFKTTPTKTASSWVPFGRLPTTGATPAEKPGDVVVDVSHKGRPLSLLKVVVMGCTAPETNGGQTVDGRWTGLLAGDICQITLRHNSLNNGLVYVYQVPESERKTGGRYFAFEAQQGPAAGQTDFNISMTIERGTLVWNRGGRKLRYSRQ